MDKEQDAYSGLFSRLHLQVRCEAEFGQVVHVSGSSFLAGKNDPTMSLEMVTTPTEYPIWRTRKPIIVPRNKPHFYQYALFEGGSFTKWEAVQRPRSVKCHLPSQTKHDSFQFGDTEDETEERDDRQMTNAMSDADALARKPVPHKDCSVFLVCFHLPVRLTKLDSPDADGKKWKVEWNHSLIAKSEHSISDQLTARWVGTVSTSDFSPYTEEEQEEIKCLLEPMNCTPLFLPVDMLKGAYLGYCKQILWPAFHNVDVLDLASCRWMFGEDSDPMLTWDQANVTGWWKDYQTLNQEFANHMGGVLKAQDVMWVHDYHLALLPKMLGDFQKEQKRPRSHAVFFLHIPFPTSQIFRALANGEELLQGMLSATVVGFHAFDHARHFLNACKRLLGLSYQSIKGGLIGVEYDRKIVMVVMSHVGIEPPMIERALELPETEQARQDLRTKHGNRIIILGIDVCQKLSGINLKLLAFERLLAEYPTWRDKVVLVQTCLRPMTRLEDETHSAVEIEQFAQRITARYGKEVVDLRFVKGGSLPLAARLAQYKCADLLVVSSVREGLNFIPLEYIFARRDPLPPGVVLASEFSACSSLCNGAIRINPFDVQRVATSLDQALTMDPMEKAGRRARDLPYISSRPSAEWTSQVLSDMWTMLGENDVTHIDDTTILTLGGDLKHDMSMKGFKPLPIHSVAEAYSHSKRRVLLFDYGGTLLEKEGLAKYLKRDMQSVTGRRLPPELMASLETVCADPLNTVFVISGVHEKGLLETLGEVEGLGLAANNGLSFSWPESGPTSNMEDRKWEVFDYGVDWGAVTTVAMPILGKFTAHTNGSSIKSRETGLAWSYYATDPEWGQMQAKQLQVELQVALAAFDVKVQHVRGQIEVVPKRLHKGVVTKTILQQMFTQTGHYPDFVLCVGDDISDELMFTSIYSFLASVDSAITDKPELAERVRAEADNARLYMCTVGKKPTHATFYVDESSEMGELLGALADKSEQSRDGQGGEEEGTEGAAVGGQDAGHE